VRCHDGPKQSRTHHRRGRAGRGLTERGHDLWHLEAMHRSHRLALHRGWVALVSFSRVGYILDTLSDSGAYHPRGARCLTSRPPPPMRSTIGAPGELYIHTRASSSP
jgi:hypothetical protein